MSDEPFAVPPVPLMTPQRARYIGRAYNALADNLATVEPGEAARAQRQSQWWLTYAIALSAAPEGEDDV